MKRFCWELMLLAGMAIAALRVSAAGDEVVVVYNNRVPDSKSIAEHYASLRQVPPNQIFGFDLTTNEEMSRLEFRDTLQRPLARAIETNKLWLIAPRTFPATTNQPSRVEWKPLYSKIRYAVLCFGVPLKIAPDPSIKEEAMEKLRPEMRRNEAAVDSELALLPLIEEKPPLTGPLRNPVYAVTNKALLHPTNGVLLVARLDGPNPNVARQLVDKALEAETNGLWGRAYIDLRNTTDPGYQLGDEWIRNAGQVCRRLGFETVVDENPDTFPPGFPMSHIAFYAGWYNQDVSGPFAQPSVEFMPGAFAYHLHSFSALTLRSVTRGWVGPLLAKGATITMGCVNEPYLNGTPDVAIFTVRLLYSSFSFGEAAWAAQPVLSWQTTVVGDPLYRPLAQNGEQIKDDLLWRNSKLAEWYYLRLLNINLANGKPVDECVKVLESFDVTRRSAILMEKLGDLYAAQGKPASAADACDKALKLEPSPQQRLRLVLTLITRLTALDREPEAYAQCQDLLKQSPDYPDRVSVYRKLVALAQKMKRPAEVDKYNALIQADTHPASANTAKP
jgi:uncharacterized protein (TIGR03790 family)